MSKAPPTLREAYLLGREHLAASGSSEPAIEAEVLLRHALQADRAVLYTRWESKIDVAAFNRYQRLLGERSTGRPVPYIVGEREFMGLVFSVDERVMIPRPETEILVEYLIQEFSTSETRKRGNEVASHDHKRPTTTDQGRLVLVDVGTGSGCIAVSLAHYLPDAHVYATDISAAALEVAAGNARRHHVADRVMLLESDLFASLPEDLEGKVPVVASNPPYVPADQAPILAREIREFEPAVAVFSPGDGMSIHKRLINEAPRWLCAGGLLAMEVGAGQADAVGDLVADHGQFHSVRAIGDLVGIERVVTARRRR